MKHRPEVKLKSGTWRSEKKIK